MSSFEDRKVRNRKSSPMKEPDQNRKNALK